MKTKVFILGIILSFMMMPIMAMADSITPDSYSDTLEEGESVTIEKIVTIDEGPPTSSKVDVFFLADSTGSMYSSIGAVQTAASTILSSTAGLGDVAFGVGEYRDVGDAFVYRTNTDLTTNQATAQTGINAWYASGGGDWPEANLFALEEVADTTSWRAGSERIVIWFGDAPGHDPRAGSTEASAIAALQAEDVSVLAIDVGSMDYYGQATRIAAATDGVYYPGIDSSTIVYKITEAIATAVEEYSSVGLDLSEVPAGVTATYSGPIAGDFDREETREFEFEVTFTADATGTYDFSIYGTVDKGRVAEELDHITVGEGGSSIPEPATMLLFGTGLLGLAVFGRKRMFK